MFRTLLLLGLLGVVACGQSAPPGYRTKLDAASSLSFWYPRDYKEIPLPPTESVLRSRWQRPRPPNELAHLRGAAKPELFVFLFRRTGGTTGQEQGGDDEVPANLRELMERQGAVNSIEELAKKRLRGYRTEEVKEHEGHIELRSSGRKKGADPSESERFGYLVHRNVGGFTVGVYGLAQYGYARQLRAIVVKMAQGLDLPVGEAGRKARARARKKFERMYRHKKDLAGIERRIAMRLGNAKGWKIIDTPHYIIVHRSKNDRLLGRLEKDIETMRSLYIELFPPVGKVDAVSVVRICRNMEEYRAYGGRPGTGGYWHPGNEELVLYDYQQAKIDREKRRKGARDVREKRRDTGHKDTLLVLYHEAFHQYIYYAVGQISPHDWFNEGHGDYYSGAVLDRYGRKVMRIDPSPWRIDRSKRQFETGAGRIKLDRLLKAERSEYYNPRFVGDFYAAGWSFVPFMRTSEVVAEHAQWSGMLDRYFDTLKRVNEEEIAKLGPDANLVQKRQAQAVARTAALAACMEGIDLEKLDAAWAEYVLRLR